MGLTITLSGGTSDERQLLALFLYQKLDALDLEVSCPCFDDNPALREELDHMLDRRLAVRVRKPITVLSCPDRRPAAKKPQQPKKGRRNGQASAKTRKR